jgi:hypothetical protein
VVKEVAETIMTAHRNGVAHGRLLPENVMISEAGSVKIVGFVVDAVIRAQPGSHPRLVTSGQQLSDVESDVLNLAGLLYAALVGRWPGTEGSALPPAPHEHGRPLRPRQVRAGVPRPLDAICTRVLNASDHPQMLPIESAHEIYAALSDYIGDAATAGPGGSTLATPVGVEPTVLLDAGDLPVGSWSTGTGGPDEDRDGEDTSDLAATGAYPPPQDRDDRDATDRPTAGSSAGSPAGSSARSPTGDPEATQAGAPVFSDAPRTRHTPPAPLPEHPERPLFADGPSAAAALAGGSSAWSASWDDDTGSSTGAQRSTGTGNGWLPATWGPDDAPPDPPDQGDDDRDELRPGRTWLRLAVILCLVLAVVLGMVLAFNLGRGPGEDPSPSKRSTRASSSATPSPTPVPISGVRDFDPQGDPADENPELAPLAVDGKPSTAWETLTYRGNPKLGGLKDGVGLLVDLGKPTRVDQVRVMLRGSPTSVDLLAAPGAGSAPTSTDGLDKVATVDAEGPRARLTPRRPVRTRWVVVWLTSLPAVPGGFQGQVAEISVRS